jgi:hypothetical protein
LQSQDLFERNAPRREMLPGEKCSQERNAPRREMLPGENYSQERNAIELLGELGSWEKQATRRFSPGTSDILGVRTSWEILPGVRPVSVPHV